MESGLDIIVLHNADRKHPYAECERCTLFKSKYVPDAIVSDAELIVIGEAPGEQEAIKGIPFVGPSGSLLAQCIRKAGGNLSAVSRHNIVGCRPPENRTPTALEVSCCMPRLLHELEKQECDKWVVLGKTAAEEMLVVSGADRDMKVTERQGHWFKYKDKNWISTWHPAYVLRKPTEAPALLNDIRKAYVGPLVNEIVLKEPEVISVETYAQMVQVLSRVKDGTKVSFDIETDQVNWYDRPGAGKDCILTVAIAWKLDFGVAIHADLLYDDPRAVPYLNSFFARVQLGAHNGKFDTLFLLTGIDVHTTDTFVFDTMLAHYTLDENSKHGLKGLADAEFGIPDYEARIIKQYLKTRNDSYSKIPYDKLILYAVWDVTVTLRLWQLYEERLRKEGQYEWPFMNLLMPAQKELTITELHGIYVDQPYLRAWTSRLEEEAEMYGKQFKEMVGEPDMNLNSPQQMAKLLYDKLRLPDPGKADRRGRNAIKSRSTDKNALQKLKGMHPCLELLGHYRRVTKMISSYAYNIMDRVSIEGKVHPSYKIHGTETGRLSAVDPAIQTIPRPDDRYGAILRSSFIAPPGYTFVIVDYSQGELRAAAGLSKDPFLLKVYEEGRDLHSEVAAAMYGPGFTKAQRVQCKMFNFSYLYGGTEHSFAESAGLPLGQAVRFVREYNKVMPRLAAWKDEMIRSALQRGYIETIFGRRRRFKVFSRETEEELRKAAVNMPVQSVMSDFNLMSGIRLSQQGIPIAILVHDSLIIQVRIEEAEAVAAKAVNMLEAVGAEFLPDVKWVADAEIADRWCMTPAEYVRSHVSVKKLQDDDELRKLVSWLKGEPEPIALIQQALQETCISRRGELMAKAAASLEV